MSLPVAVSIPAEVMSRQVADEIVILDLASGNYYGLDPVGARVWQLLAEGKTPSQARDVLLTEYEVDADRLEADMVKLFSDLQAKGLLTPA